MEIIRMIFFNSRFTFYNDSSDFDPKMFPGIKGCHECPNDCEISMYQFSIIPVWNGSNHTADLLIELLDTDPVIEIEFSVKLSLIEYIIYMAGCMGLWFGFSMYQTVLEVVTVLKKSLEKQNPNKILVKTTHKTIQYPQYYTINLITAPWIANHNNSIHNN